jgi:hypothetical protein
LPPRGSPMSLSVVPTADKPEDSSAVNRMVTIATATDGRGKCMMRSARRAAKRHRYPLSLGKDDPCTAANATPKSGVNPSI